MKPILSERNLVVILFVMVLVTFSFAQEDSKKMVEKYSAINTGSSVLLLGQVSATSVKGANTFKSFAEKQ